MNATIQAFLEFLTDLFAALAQFLGGTFDLTDIIGSLTGETTTAVNEATTAAE